MLDGYKKRAKQKADQKRQGNDRRLDSEKVDLNSVLFSGKFANGAVECEVLTDQGSDTNLISTKSGIH